MTIFDDVAHDSRLYKEIASLRELGYEVEILCVGYTRARHTTQYNNAIKHRVYVGRATAGKLRFLRFYLKGPLEAVRRSAEVYHAHDLYTLPVAYLAARLRARPIVYDSRELFLDTASLSTRLFERSLWRVVERCLVPHVDKSITVGDAIANVLRARYRIPRPLVVRNCPANQTSERSDLLRSVHGIDRDSRILLYLGGLQRGRGLFRIVESLVYLPGYAFVAVGGGPLLNELIQHARSLHVENQLFFVQAVPVERIIEYAASADLGLCVIENAGFSYAHSLPNKLFEYISAGLPVVASDLPEMGRIVREEQVGLLVDPDDPRGIANAVRRILEDVDLYKACRAHCVRASKKYSWQKESRPLVDMYRRLASQAGTVQ